MSQTAPTLADAIPPAPSTSNISVFDSVADTFFAAWANVRSQFNALATNAYANAVDCYSNSMTASTAASNASASATAAASASSAAAWVSGNTYALNAAAISQIDFQTYRKITASSVTTIDPKNDAANWTKLGGGLSTVTVTGTTHTAAAGTRILLTNAAATAVTMPAGADLSEIEIVPANGLMTNTVDFGAATVIGPNGSATGVVTLNLGAAMHVQYSSTLVKWVML